MGSDKFFSLFGKIVLVVVVLGAIAYGAYYFGAQKGQKQSFPETQTPTTEVSQTAVSPTPTVNETSLLKTVIKQTLAAKHGSDANTLNISVSKIQGDYAQGGATEQGGGGMWFAAKVNGSWKLVWDGNGVILCSDLTAYPNFPTDMIPECYDQTTQKIVKR
ncbi:MAG: hypothetical protein Q8P80_01315 [Candidatus Levybacteria bacterium]|nr:hypothetical protein [Candidatus Levybacteria bacterium]